MDEQSDESKEEESDRWITRGEYQYEVNEARVSCDCYVPWDWMAADGSAVLAVIVI